MEPGARVIVGLGNPGSRYAGTRHNAGYWLLDEVARLHGGQFRSEPRFHGELCRITVAGSSPWLLKPATYMNRSGTSVGSLAAFYKVPPDQILVVHDDIDLPAGTVRFKQGGGHGGHNGLRDIHRQLGTPDYLRLRLGVGHPGQRDDVVGYVLTSPPAVERQLIEAAIEAALEQLEQVVAGDFAAVMRALHGRAAPPP